MRVRGDHKFGPAIMAAVWAFALSPGPAHAQATLTPLGFLDTDSATTPASQALGLSGDGATAVGSSFNASDFQEAFRWNGGSMAGLGFLAGGSTSIARGTSADGSVVVGDSTSTNASSYYEAFRWFDGTMTGLGFLPGGSYSFGLGVSGDGSVVVGFSPSAAAGGNTEAFRWVHDGSGTGGTMTGLGFLSSGFNLSLAYGTNADGSVVVGYSFNAGGFAEAFRWAVTGSGPAGVMTGLGFLPNGYDSEAHATNADGSVVVGSGRDTSAVTQAFIWNGGPMIGLGFLDPNDIYQNSSAYDVSADGSVVVGNSLDSANVQTAFVWTEPTGMKSVAEWLGPDVDLDGIVLQDARGVSDDGSTVAGTMVRNGFTEAYLARGGGLISPEDVAASFAEVAAPGAVAGSSVGQTAENGLACIDVGSNGACAFGDLRYDLDPVLTGSVGMSVRVGDRGRVGASVGYTHQDIGLAFDGSAASDAPLASVFLGGGTPDGLGPQTFAAFAYGHFDAVIDRGYVNGSGTATSHGETTINSLGGYARLAWGMPIGATIVATPFADLTGTWSHQDAYSETSGPFPASFDARDDLSLVTRLGLNSDMAVTPRFHLLASAAWAHRAIDDADPVTGELIGLFPATAAAPATASDWAEASVGGSVQWGQGTTGYAKVAGKIVPTGGIDYSVGTGLRQAF